MKSLQRPVQISGLTQKNSLHSAKKLDAFYRAGASNLQIVFDFDRTLTVAFPDQDKDVTSWGILNSHLPPAGKELSRKFYEHYRVLELTHTMTIDQAMEWWTAVLDLFVEHKIDMAEVENSFLDKITMRPKTKEIFDICASQNIPTIILSAGIKNIIDLWVQHYKIEPTIVLSTALELDDDKKVCGYDKTSVIHALNKKEVGHPELTKIRQERPYTIVVGDSVHDANMAIGDETVYRILIDDPRVDEASKPIADIPEPFDAVIQNGSLAPLLELIRRIAV